MPRRDSSAKPGSERIKEFTIVKKLGKGAFASVYQVQRAGDGRMYALKKVNIRSMSTREIEDALNEIRFLASVKHPNIVGFLEAFLNERSMELCIVMEYADGGDLQHKIEGYTKKRKYMPEDLVWAFILQLIEGVVCLHERKVLHRDLKTANCFLTKENKLKIGDLNVSKLARNKLVKTQIGTPYYMSPEIWQNRPYNDKSDIWSIGCILYEMCALRPPFRGRDLEDLAKRVQAGYYPRIPSQYSSDMDATIRALLNLEPRKRPSAKQILELPQVKKRLAQNKAMLMGTLISELESEGQDMLATIHVPRNIRRITNQLPKPAYPDSRPRSPEAWPVTAPGRAREIQKMAGGLPPTIEEDEGPSTVHSAPKSSRRSPAAYGDPASRSDPMKAGRNNAAEIRSAARDQIAGVKRYQPHKYGKHSDGASVGSSRSRASHASRNAPSGYANNNRGVGGYQQPKPAHYRHPSSKQPNAYNYQRPASQLPAVADPRRHGHGSHHSGSRERAGAHASAPAAAPVNPYSYHKPGSGYAANYHSPYGQRSGPGSHGSRGSAKSKYSYPQPKRYSGNQQRAVAAAYGGRHRPSQASVYSNYSNYNKPAPSHRSQASQPSWWG